MNGNGMYGVKLVYRYAVDGEVFYEEQVLRVQADSFESAMEKAEQYAQAHIDREHVNPLGQKVEESVCEEMNCYEITEDGDPQEIYSSIMKNNARLPEEAFLDILTGGCEREDMLPLRYFRDPETPDEF